MIELWNALKASGIIPPFVFSALSIVAFIAAGRLIRRYHRYHVYNIIRVFSGSFVISLVAIFVSKQFGYLSENGTPNSLIGKIVYKVFEAELNIELDIHFFLMGCVILFTPQLITLIFGLLLDCLPKGDPIRNSKYKSIRVRNHAGNIEIAMTGINISRDLMKWIDPFYWLSLFLIKSFILCAAVLDAGILASIYYGWDNVDSQQALKVIGITAFLLVFSIVSSFVFDVTRQVLFDETTRSKILGDLVARLPWRHR